MSRWPSDNQSALIAFYGDPGTGAVARQLVPVVPPFKMYYDGKPVKHLLIHTKAAAAFQRAFAKIWNYYDRDQEVINQKGISRTAGTYCCRKIRGSATRWSNHAFGAALDLNAEENGFNAKSTIPLPVIAAFKSEGMRWGGDYKRRKDPMHFECCASGEPQLTFEEWLDHYGCPRQYAAPVTLMDTSVDTPENGVATESEGIVPTDVTSEVTDGPKPRMGWLKAKLGRVLNLLGLGTGGAGAVVANDDNLQRSFVNLISNPHFLWLVIIVLAVGFGIYWYWKDHQ